MARVSVEDAAGVGAKPRLVTMPAWRDCAALVTDVVEVLADKLTALRMAVEQSQRAAPAPPPPAPPPAPAEPPSRLELPPEDAPPPAPPPPTPWAFRFGLDVLADRAAAPSIGPGLLASVGFRYGAFSASPQVHWGAPAGVKQVGGHEASAARLTWGLAVCWHEEARAKLRAVGCVVGEGGNILVHAQTGDDSFSFEHGGLGPRVGVEMPFPLPGLPRGLFVHLGGEVLWGFGLTHWNNKVASVDIPRGNLGLGGGLLLEWPPRSVRQ
jgi:hypothetical protein